MSHAKYKKYKTYEEAQKHADATTSSPDPSEAIAKTGMNCDSLPRTNHNEQPETPDEDPVSSPRTNGNGQFVPPNEDPLSLPRTNDNRQPETPDEDSLSSTLTDRNGQPVPPDENPSSSNCVTVYATALRVRYDTNVERIRYGVYFGSDDPNNTSELLRRNGTVKRAKMTAVLHAMRIAVERKMISNNGGLHIYTDSSVSHIASMLFAF